MISILSADSYGGFASWINGPDEGHNPGGQPIFIGRVTWPGSEEPVDTVIKLYPADSCGVANEVIGYVANAKGGIVQPPRGGVLVLPTSMLPPFAIDTQKYTQQGSGVAVCWATPFIQGAKPFRFYRRLAAFDRSRLTAFLKSKFCHMLTCVDHVTGNNDRTDANFMCLDDFKYIAIDQGSVAGGFYWHINWPEDAPKNQLFELARTELVASHFASWQADTLTQAGISNGIWPETIDLIRTNLEGILAPAEIDTIVDYMHSRATVKTLAQATGHLF